MLNLLLKELKLIAKNRGIKCYKSMTKDKLFSMLNTPEQRKQTIKDIEEENFDTGKILRDMRTLFELEEDYYEPLKISKVFDNNYIEYKRSGDKDKTLSIKINLNKIKPYLSNTINYLKTQGEWKIFI